jgi:hypothetical protein
MRQGPDRLSEAHRSRLVQRLPNRKGQSIMKTLARIASFRAGLACLALALAASCTARLTPEGESVWVITKTTGCKALGVVEAQGPYALPGDALAVMKSKAAVLGGNSLFVTVRAKAGVAYYCPERKAAEK